MKFKQFILAAAMLVAAVPVQAGTSQKTLQVTANIIAPTAVITTNPVSFGTILKLDSTATATGSISLTVTNAVPYKIYINKGLHAATTGTCRHMALTGVAQSTRPYNLFSDAGLTKPWGDSDLQNTCAGTTNNGGAGVAGTGTGNAQAYPVFAKLAGQGTGTGSFSDSLTVLVVF